MGNNEVDGEAEAKAAYVFNKWRQMLWMGMLSVLGEEVWVEKQGVFHVEFQAVMGHPCTKVGHAALGIYHR